MPFSKSTIQETDSYHSQLPVSRESDHRAQPVTPSPFPTGSSRPDEFIWPAWARTARIAGAYFHFNESTAEIEARLDNLAAQQVSVILADSPWGEQWAAWVDDEIFDQVQTLIAGVVQKAHARGMKVVLYQVGLELIAEPTRNPGVEQPTWAQRSLTGSPILFNDVTNAEQHWLHEGNWVMWLSPCAQATADNGAGKQNSTFRDLAFARVAAMVQTGIDGLWVDEVYLQSSVGSHHELWPSTDPCSVAAFHAATGFAAPRAEDWDDPAFLQWVVWRHEQIAEFLLAEKAVARAVNPQLVFLNENSSIDTGRATYVGNDPARYLDERDMSTGHEIESLADRMDEGETGMQNATLDDWLAFRTMVAFARAADRGKPSWILTYGYAPQDSAQLAGIVLAEGANFYETKGPQMADTVGDEFRSKLFAWIADHTDALYSGESIAQVGLLFSPRTRDLLDTVSGEPYDVQDSVHFATYRAVANRLYRAQIPFDILIDTDTAAFARYQILLLPETQAMSETTLNALQNFPGTVVRIGEAGMYDEWFGFREETVVLGTVEHQLPSLTTTNRAEVLDAITAIADTQQLQSAAPPSLQLGLRRGRTGYTVVAVNLAATPTMTATLTLATRAEEDIMSVHLSTLEGESANLHFTKQEGTASTTAGEMRVGQKRTDGEAEHSLIHITLPAGIKTVAIITIRVQR